MCYTPVACRYGAEGVVRQLLRAGADVGAATKEGRTPLQVTCI